MSQSDQLCKDRQPKRYGFAQLAWADKNKEFLVVNPDGASVTAQRNFSPLFSSLDVS